MSLLILKHLAKPTGRRTTIIALLFRRFGLSK